MNLYQRIVLAVGVLVFVGIGVAILSQPYIDSGALTAGVVGWVVTAVATIGLVFACRSNRH